MKIALLTKYGDLAASTRQRFNLYKPFLMEAGFEFEPLPLLDDAYLRKLYSGGERDIRHVASLYWRRLAWLLSKPDVDLIWLHCELFPFLPGLTERFALLPGKPIVFDFDDAIFHNYDLHSNRIIRTLLGKKIATPLRSSKMAFCGNDYLASYARSFCSEVQIVPTIVDTDLCFPDNERVRASGPPRIGWIGSPSTWAEYMVPMMPMLADVASVEGARILAVGAGRAAEHPLLDNLEWSEETEVARIREMDVGLMPLTDTPWARGKCGYKLIQYMACGVPVIASPVGVNAEIVEHGVNGLLATTEAEWREALAILLRDPDLRRRMGQAGRAKVEERYSLKVWGPRVAGMLVRAAGMRTG